MERDLDVLSGGEMRTSFERPESLQGAVRLSLAEDGSFHASIFIDQLALSRRPSEVAA